MDEFIQQNLGAQEIIGDDGLPMQGALQVQGQQSVIAMQAEEIKEPPTQPDPLAERWLKRIESAKKHWEKFYERCEHNRDIVAGFDWECEPKTSSFVKNRVNILHASLATMLPNIYAKDPDISIVPTRDVSAEGGNFTLFTKTLEKVLNTYLRRARLKSRGKSVVRAAMTCSYGVLKVVYQRDLNTDPIIKARLEDAQDNLRHIDGLLARLNENEGDYQKLEAQKQELIETIKGYQAQAEAEKVDGVIIDRLLTEQLIIDPNIVDPDDFKECAWMAQAVPMRRGLVEETYKIKVPRATKFAKDSVLGDKEIRHNNSSVENNDEDDTVLVYEIWDKQAERVYTMCDGCSYFLREPYTPEKIGQRFYPFFILPFNRVDGKMIAPSLVDLIEKLQEEHNERRDALDEHRQMCKPGYIANADIDSRSIDRFCDANLGEIVILKNVEGNDLRQVIQPKIYPQIDPALYDTAPIRQDIEVVSGLQDAQRSTVVKPKTATEAQIMQQGLSARVAEFRDSVEDFLQEIGQYVAQVLLRELDEQKVAQICGAPYQVQDNQGMMKEVKPYAWPSLTMEHIANMIEVQIAAGSTGAPDKLQAQDNWQKLLPTLTNLVGQLYQLKQQGTDTAPIERILEETLKRYDDRLDYKQLIPDISQQQVVMQMAQQMAQQMVAKMGAQAQQPNLIPQQ